MPHPASGLTPRPMCSLPGDSHCLGGDIWEPFLIHVNNNKRSAGLLESASPWDEWVGRDLAGYQEREPSTSILLAAKLVCLQALFQEQRASCTWRLLPSELMIGSPGCP